MAPAMTAAKRNFMGKSVVARQTRAARAVARRNASLVVKAGAYDEELIATAVSTHERERDGLRDSSAPNVFAPLVPRPLARAAPSPRSRR